MNSLKVLFYVNLFFLITSIFTACANNESDKPPFWSEIQEYKKADSLNFPPPNGIVFIGSSSFNGWNDLESVFKDYNAINRGFGGSNLIDANYYAKDIIFPYQPRQIVIYSGENDIPADTVDARMVLGRFKTLFKTIRSNMPEVHVAYISIKPSPSREEYLPIIKESNALIKSYLATQKNAAFIDIFPLMLTQEGNLRPELYVSDKLHMNNLGYDIWIKAITPYLIKK